MGRYFYFGKIKGIPVPYLLGHKQQDLLAHLKNQEWLADYGTTRDAEYDGGLGSDSNDDDETKSGHVQSRVPWLVLEGYIFVNRRYSIRCKRYGWSMPYDKLPHTGCEYHPMPHDWTGLTAQEQPLWDYLQLHHPDITRRLEVIEFVKET